MNKLSLGATVLAPLPRGTNRHVRGIINLILAGIAAKWIGWWSVVWFAASIADIYTYEWVAEQVRVLWGRGDGAREQWLAAVPRSIGAIVQSSLWIAVWVVAGADGAFLAGIMVTTTAIPALIYWPKSLPMFIAFVAPPVVLGTGLMFYFHPHEMATWMVLPILLAAGLRVYWLRRDQQSLFETLIHNRAMRRSAEEANVAKSQFLAMMSHELRTPLNAVIGYAEILEEDLSAEGKKDASGDAARIRRAARDLLGLINEVLDLSKIEAGKMELVVERTNVSDVVDDVVSTTRHIAEANGNIVAVEIDPAIGELMIDGPKFRQCLLNLMSNACKFTNAGAIDLRVGVTPVDGGLMLESAVTDTGIGISPEQASRLFQPFVQADSSLTRAKGGTGLGLVITRRLAQLMGGDVTMSSEAGSGSRFVLTVAAARYEEGAQEQKPSDAPIVLVIEDESAARDLVRRALNRMPLNVICVGTAAAGLSTAARQAPALIVLDIHLPDGSGWDLLAAFRSDPALAETPVLVVSIDDDRQRALALGACEHLVKPVDRDRLAAAVMRFIRIPERAKAA